MILALIQRGGKIRNVVFAILFFLMSFLTLGQNVLVAKADCTGVTCAQQGLDASAKGNFNTDSGPTASNSVDVIVGNIITTALSLLGVVFVLLMIYGGFLWMMARGEEAQVTKAKDLIQAAIIGLVIVIGAYAIAVFVISKLQAGTLQ